MYHKIAVTSDNHINILFEDNYAVNKLIEEQVQHIKEEQITHLIINGDISWDKKQTDYYINLLSYNLKGICEVSYNIGNHDLSNHYTLEEYLNIEDKRYLPNNEIVLTESKQVIIGNDGFFDYNFIQSFLDEDTLDDLNRYSNTRYFKNEEDISPKDVLTELLKQAEHKLKYYSENGYDIIYITHYIPKQEFVLPNSSQDLIFKNAFMGSPVIGELLEKYNVKKCYFGHTHRRLGSNKLKGITYICNPVGLPKNWVENGINDSDFMTEWKRTLEIVYTNPYSLDDVINTHKITLYRGFSKDLQDWVIGNLVVSNSNINNGGHFILPELTSIEKTDEGFQIGSFIEVIPESVGQYTGVRKLYSGDHVEIDGLVYTVKWNISDCSFKLYPDVSKNFTLPLTLSDLFAYQYTKVGNLYEGLKLF